METFAVEKCIVLSRSPRAWKGHAVRADFQDVWIFIPVGRRLVARRANEGSAHKDVIESCIAEGKLVPVEIAVSRKCRPSVGHAAST